MFGGHIRRFSNNLSALRDFVDLIAPILQEKSSEYLVEHANLLVPMLFGIDDLLFDESELDESIRNFLLELLDEEPGYEIEVDEETGRQTIRILTEPKPEQDVRKIIRESVKTGQHRALLYSSGLISLISSTEWFLSGILHEYFREYPNAAGTREKVFSLETLQNLGSVEEAKAFIIDSTVENILRSGFEDWVSFFEDTVNLSMGYLVPDKDQLIEVYQRRNLVVHNGGVVNSIYLSKVSPALRDGVAKGDELRVSHKYLQNAIEQFERCFILIACELWKKLDPRDEVRGVILQEVANLHLLKGRWSVAESLSFFLAQDKRLPERDQLVGQINYWQSRKWQGEFDKIRSDVENADFSAKDEIFKLTLPRKSGYRNMQKDV